MRSRLAARAPRSPRLIELDRGANGFREFGWSKVLMERAARGCSLINFWLHARAFLLCAWHCLGLALLDSRVPCHVPLEPYQQPSGRLNTQYPHAGAVASPTKRPARPRRRRNAILDAIFDATLDDAIAATGRDAIDARTRS